MPENLDEISVTIEQKKNTANSPAFIQSSAPLIIIFILLSLGITFLGYIFYENQKANLLEHSKNELISISEAKTKQIENWFTERINDGKSFSNNRIVNNAVKSFFEKNNDSLKKSFIKNWFQSIDESYNYFDEILLNKNYSIQISSKPGRILNESEIQFLDRYKNIKNVQIAGLRRDEEQHFIDLIIPLIDNQNNDTSTIGRLILEIDLGDLLSLLTQYPTTHYKTTEFVVFKGEKDSVVYLNELKKQKKQLFFKKSRNDTGIVAVKALTKQQNILEGIDYNGDEVIAYSDKIAHTSWYLVTKIDKEEVYEPIKKISWVVSLLAALLMTITGVSIGFIWRYQARYYKKLYDSEIGSKVLAEQYDFLSKYANDVILLLDEKGNIIQANEKASLVYGYANEDLKGKNISLIRTEKGEKIFSDIVEKNTRINGLIYETEHINKDGIVFPVESSIREINIEGKRFFQAILRDITDRKKALESLQKSEEKFSKVFFSSPEMISISRLTDGKLIEVNDTFLKFTGYKREEVIGKTSIELGILKKEEREGFYKEIINKGNLVNKDVAFYTKNGQKKIALASSELIVLDGIKYLLLVISDITERKLMEEKLKEAEEKYRSIFENSIEGIFQSTVDAKYISVNPALASILGYSSTDELLSEVDNIENLYVNREKRNEFINLLNERGTVYNFETEVYKKDKSIIWISMTARALYDADKELKYYEGSIVDITQRKRNENLLEKTSAQLKLLYETGQRLNRTLDVNDIYKMTHHFIGTIMDCDAMFISSYDSETEIITCLAAWGDKRSLDVNKLPQLHLDKTAIGTQSQAIVTGKSIIVENFQKDRKTITPMYIIDESGEVRKGVPDDTTIVRSALIVPLKLDNRVIGVIQIFSYKENSYNDDNLKLLESITLYVSSAINNARLYKIARDELLERIRAEERIKKSEERYKNLFEKANEAIVIFEPESEIVLDVNNKACETYGFTKEEFIGKSLKEISENVKRGEEQISNLLLTGELNNFETVQYRKDGGKLEFIVNSSLIYFHDKKAVLTINHDISERKKIEEQIRSSLREKELLIREVHHRVKNNLQIISSLLKLQSRNIDDPTIKQYFINSQNRVRSMSLIHQKLYSASNLSHINFYEYVRNLCSELMESYGVKHGKIKINIEANDIYFNLDTAIPCGLLINEIVSNSLKYAFPCGREGEINIRVFRDDIMNYNLILSDNGVGIQEENDIKNFNTLGMQLIESLTQQLGGKISRHCNDGMLYRIAFPELIYKKRI